MNIPATETPMVIQMTAPMIRRARRLGRNNVFIPTGIQDLSES